MKAAFKYLFVMVSMLAMTISFVGCSDDDNDDASSSIVGTWVYEEDFGDDDYYYEEITFKSNGTFIVEWEEFYDGDYDSDTVKGTYEIDGDEIIVEFADEISIITIVSITSNKIVIEDEYGDRLTYHRK